MPGLEDRDRALLLVDLVVGVLGQHRAATLANSAYHFDLVLGRAGDDQRGAGLVDQDRVDLVDDREVGAALDAVLEGVGHVVAQVVEAELVVGRVGDVGSVGLAALVGRHVGQDHADGQAEELVHPAHPLGVVLREVVVDRDDVDALAGERVEVRRERGDQGLALTGLHLGDVAEVQRRAAHDLDVEVALAEHPLGRLADRRERLGHQRRRGSRPSARRSLNSSVMAAQLLVGHRDEVVLDGVDGPDDRLRAGGGSCPRRCAGPCRAATRGTPKGWCYAECGANAHLGRSNERRPRIIQRPTPGQTFPSPRDGRRARESAATPAAARP